ncbi:sporulation inhibitor of replication protein SirA [Lentibacillus salinarum]|uniref:Sporulation inhibitor of replication protein SirA n=1 Tax=Lentibacillus salinarum TaxID=446820 RepID=A0ABW3ZQ37_9BACI
MNHYTIYWVKEEFARFFYYRSDVLYRFLKSYEQHQSREIIARQFHYITLDIPEDMLISNIMQSHPSHANLITEGNSIKIYQEKRCISLHIEQKRINFRGNIIYDAEDLLFPALRSIHPYFFVVGAHPYDFGWIAPVTLERNMDKHEQVLYSHL